MFAKGRLVYSDPDIEIYKKDYNIISFNFIDLTNFTSKDYSDDIESFNKIHEIVSHAGVCNINDAIPGAVGGVVSNQDLAIACMWSNTLYSVHIAVATHTITLTKITA